MLFNLSRSLSLCFQKKANSELFFPTQNNILQPNIISIDSTGEKRETRKSLLSCVIKEIKILCANKQKTNKQKKDFPSFWMDGGRVKKAESALLNFFVCVACRSSSLVRLFRVLLFSIIMLLKLHLFHSSLSQFTPLFLFLILSYSSFPLSFSSFLFLSLSLSLSLLRYSWRVKRPAANVVGTKARAQNSLSLCLWSKIKKITKRSSPRRRFRRPKL